ncbi:MAG: universal stress protein [Candidatus Tectomicrobia bacterium]|nr:universal stress protein [Candidatus Tectomicrobia bacterium]
MTAQNDHLSDELQSANRAREEAYFRRLGSESGTESRGRAGQPETSQGLPSPKSPFSPILVPVDFSAYSAEALEKAADIAAPGAALLIVMHVASAELAVHDLAARLGKRGAGVQVLGTEEIQDACQQVIESVIGPQREQDYEALQAILPDRLAHHAVELRVVFGQPFQRIVETAVAEDTGLIVMGTHGRTGLERVAVGSVAERVIRLAPCPVLTVKAAVSESGNWLKDLYASLWGTGAQQ